MWSFVAAKENKQWIWSALDVTTKQVIAFYVGDHWRKSANLLWKRIPHLYRDHASCATDDWEAHKGVIAEGGTKSVRKDQRAPTSSSASTALSGSAFLVWCAMR